MFVIAHLPLKQGVPGGQSQAVAQVLPPPSKMIIPPSRAFPASGPLPESAAKPESEEPPASAIDPESFPEPESVDPPSSMSGDAVKQPASANAVPARNTLFKKVFDMTNSRFELAPDTRRTYRKAGA